ncbi:MAG: DsrE family protein [Nocardiopsaceae bacterium]|jgi:predicted peroxiredoxin|nr:DsrE family protein [Nocardiopsaceae bacterium]
MASGALIVKATAGKNDPERCNQAFTVAATAVASGAAVSLWLTGEATLLAVPGQAGDFRLPYATPLDELLETILKAGSVTVCSQCAARREITQDDLINGVRIAGATTFVAEVLADGAQALVY